MIDKAKGYNADGLALKNDVKKLIEKTLDRFGKLDILVNNVGILSKKNFLEVINEECYRHIKVNLTGTFYCSQFAAREMNKQNRGKIINIASVEGETPIKY